MLSTNFDTLITSLLTKFDWELLLNFSISLFLAYVCLLLIKKIILSKLDRILQFSENSLASIAVHLLVSFQWPFYLALSIVLTQQVINLPYKLENITSQLLWITFTFYLAKTACEIIQHAFDSYSQKEDRKAKFDDSILKIIRKIIHSAVWLIASLILLQNLGYNISTLVGGLGVVGVAVAFGVQNILEDFFSFVSIYFDKPFKPGDFIMVGDDRGVVAKIGIKSTRIKTVRGEELIISNKELTQSRINNFKIMNYRQDFFDLYLDFNTPTKKLKKVPDLVEAVIKEQNQTKFIRCSFKEIGKSAHVFNVAYKVKTKDYDKFRQIKQEINLGILAKFEKAGIELAMPSQTIYLNKN
ncbi:MAG: mechanosensitive ion channel [Patescibacteria group bacterium]|nr:mechanosensitive ion channel [Patescibacteria group bacterium]